MRTFLLFLFCGLQANALFGNIKPTIYGQVPLSTKENTPITIKLTDLLVFDLDDPGYPEGFTLKVSSGSNYAVQGSTVTPNANFSGTIKVNVRVNDGEEDSKNFELKVTVVNNVKPSITGQQTLSMAQGESFTVQLSQLTVNDSDNNYPEDFTLKVYAGANYTVSGSTVTPALSFHGVLTVQVSVHDGFDESAKFNLKINVIEAANVPPQITGQNPLTTQEEKAITLKLGDLKVTDPDNSYPTGFTMNVNSGQNYSVTGLTVTPAVNFSGTLSVPVTVNDGTDESASFSLQIAVTPENDKPIITGQTPLSTNKNTPITIALAHLTVTDPDNGYPQGFTLKVYAGANYTVSGKTVTPAASFIGVLTVEVSVHDGTDESAKFDLKITVIETANVPPQITGQNPLTTQEDKAITLKLGDLKVTDPDNSYPSGFTMKAAAGQNYSVAGLVVTPAVNFSGTLSVPVTVNDGKDDSPSFSLQITVTAENDKPIITGQTPLSTNKNTPITIGFAHLTVVDPDNKYPDDFTLAIATGANYTVSGKTITPAENFTGTLSVDVTVNDGAISSTAFKLKVTVIAPANIRPVITGQQPVTTISNNSVTLQLTDLIVSDADNSYPQDFTMALSAGDNYTVSGMTITPSQNYTGILTVKITVNDGTSASEPFNFKITVQPGNEGIPQITGQKTLRIKEDESLTLDLSHITVEDKDTPYPTGFKMNVLSGKNYTNSELKIIPDANFNGYLTVAITVSDGKNTSPAFNLAILIDPVNDPPELTLETGPLSFEPGSESIAISEQLEVFDIDDETLSFAEIGIRHEGYNEVNDVLIFENTPSIRGIYDTKAGILSLIGNATVTEYRDAIRSIRYDHRTRDDSDMPVPIAPGPKVVYVNLNDGTDVSATMERTIVVESILLDIPTGFTPNGDLINDTWDIRVLTSPEQFQSAIIRIYDKRGVMVYHATGLDQEWDGFHDGICLPAETYFYTIDLKLTYARKNFQGVVTIVR